MNYASKGLDLLEEGFRWFGPPDPVPLSHIRQSGATAVFTSLHQIPYGEPWPRSAISDRKRLLESAGLRWAVVESVPVHEAIKIGRGNLNALLDNYAATLRNLASEGINDVIYNFMPVLDWVRTDLHYVLPDGSECLRFDPTRFAAFELFALQRAGAENDYSEAQRYAADEWWRSLEEGQQATFIQTIIDVFPGVKWGLNLDDIRSMLKPYAGIDADLLRANLARFLDSVVPVAEAAGVRLAIHPDDPPFPVLGLPRIVSRAADISEIFRMADSPANGLCFCTGSFGARGDNDLPAMIRQFASRIPVVHLRSTQHLPDGSFYEADHLAGSVPMPAVIEALLDEQDRRVGSGRADWQITLRPDHGHTMLDDLAKPPLPTPGYSAIGRLRGLAELRGLMLGLRYAKSRQGGL